MNKINSNADIFYTRSITVEFYVLIINSEVRKVVLRNNSKGLNDVSKSSC